jgi:hypothetical protein
MKAADTWLGTGQLQGWLVRIEADDPALSARAEEFLAPFVGHDGETSGELQLQLHLCTDGARGVLPPSAVATSLQFLTVACFSDGATLHFQTKDGSTLEADPAAGTARGMLTRDLVGRRYLFADLLMAALMEMLKFRGYYGLHAAGVSRGGTGYLFPACASQGKTTTALGLIKHGFQYLADDKVLLTREDGDIAALAFTRRFNIDPDIAERYRELDFVPGLEPLPGCAKRPVNVSTVYPNSFILRFRPRYVIHLERAVQGDSRIVPLSRTESFARLIRQTILAFDRQVAMQQLALLGRLLDRTQSYLLYNGNDLYGNPARLAGLLPGG